MYLTPWCKYQKEKDTFFSHSLYLHIFKIRLAFVWGWIRCYALFMPNDETV